MFLPLIEHFQHSKLSLLKEIIVLIFHVLDTQQLSFEEAARVTSLKLRSIGYLGTYAVS